VHRRDATDPLLGDYWVEYEPANLVDWGELRVPEMFTACFPGKSFGIRIEVVLETNGPECVALSRLDYGSPPLTSERSFPLRAMVNASIRAAAVELVEVPVDQVDPNRDDPRLVPDEHGRVRVYAPAFDDRGGGQTQVARSSGNVEEDLRRVAALYRRAVAAGIAPSSAISEVFGVTPATARKWVQRARQRGFLGASLGRRVGEAPPVAAGRRTRATGA
jgi:hypothetical protein